MTKAQLLSKYEYHLQLLDVAMRNACANDIEHESARAELAFTYWMRA